MHCANSKWPILIAIKTGQNIRLMVHNSFGVPWLCLHATFGLLGWVIVDNFYRQFVCCWTEGTRCSMVVILPNDESLLCSKWLNGTSTNILPIFTSVWLLVWLLQYCSDVVLYKKILLILLHCRPIYKDPKIIPNIK